MTDSPENLCAPEALCAKDFNFWCAVNSKPFRLAQHVWPDGSVEWDVEVFPGRPEATVAYGTGQADEAVAAASAFAFAAGVEWGELWARDAEAGADAEGESEDDDSEDGPGGHVLSPEECLLAEALAEHEDLPPPEAVLGEPPNEQNMIAQEDESEEGPAPEEESFDDGMPYDDGEPYEEVPDDEEEDDREPIHAGYCHPPLDLLQPPAPHQTNIEDEATLADNARVLETVLRNFKVRGEIMEVRQGPVVTLYEFEPLPGTKSSTVINLADDIARSMSVITTRIAVVPGRSVIGIELPNAMRESVYLREILESPAFQMTSAHLALALGNDIGGQPVVVDLARMPHLLIAGTTGSGKSVGINAMILSLLCRLPPERCRMIMVDPKMLELSIYDGIPHLLAPVVTDPHKAVRAMKWAVREMETRYRAMSLLGVRNIEGYNARLAEIAESGQKITHRVQVGFDRQAREPLYEERPIDLTALPYIVVVVDEMADLMLVAGREIEAAIQRLAQMARAAGIHLIMATQRPSVDVITGTIKANFPTRISFQVTSKIDSRTILGEAGAEQLVGQGDMLYMAGGGRIRRVHGAFVSDAEVEQIASHLRAQGEPEYLTSITDDDDDMVSSAMDEAAGITASGDDLYDQAVSLVVRERKVSISFIQRHLQIGYNRSARMVERMEGDGIVSGADHTGKREVIGGR